MKKKNPEFEAFDATMRKLVSVPHDRLKAALDAEKRNPKPRKSKKASDRASGGKG